MEGKSEIEKRLLEYTDFTKIGRRRKGEIKDLIISLEDNEKIEYYLKLLSARLSVDDKISIINKIGKAEEYINELQKGINKLGLNSVEIKELILSTGNIKKYLTKELCQNIDKEASKELINDILNNENYNIIYELGFDHTVINDTKIIYENLEEILTIENKSEKFDLLRRLYKNNNDIVKVDFSMLNDRYLNALGEEKISLISCYPEFANKILRLDDIRLKILGKCIDNFQDKLQTDEWTDICKKIINNIGYTYDNKYENNAYLSQEEFEEYIATNGAYPNLIKEIEKLSNEEFDLLNFDTLSKIFSEPNLYNIDSIDKVNNYEEFRINEIKKWYQNVKLNKIDQKKFYILLSIFDLGVDETEKIIDKYGECIEDIEDQDLKYFVKSIQKLMELNDEDVLDEIFYNVKPIKNVNNIEIIRQLKTEYGKMFNKDLLSIQDTIKSEEYGRNVYELAKDEDGNIKQFNVIVTTLAPFVSNTPDNYYKDWNRPSIGSQHFCACYIRRNMLAMPRIKYISYGFSSMADDALMLMGRSDISSSTQSFVSHADRR